MVNHLVFYMRKYLEVQLEFSCNFLLGRERAVQEMRRLGFSTTSLPSSSPLSSTLRSPSRSPERACSVTTERTEKYVIKSVA